MDTELHQFKEAFFPVPERFKFDESVDEATGEKRMRVIGQVQEADVVNNNKRFYPREVLSESVGKLMEEVRAGRAFGEVDHPDVKGSLKNASHRVMNVWWDKENEVETNRLMAEVVVFNTPSGEILKEIVRAGGRPGFSSRGSGKSTLVKMPGSEDEVERIEKGFKLESFDFVINPSVSRAQITKIIESVQDGNSKKEEPMKLDELKAQEPELVKALKEEFDTEAKPQVEALQHEVERLTVKVTGLETEMAEKDAEINKHLETVTLVQRTLAERGYVQLSPAPAPEPAAGEEDEEKKQLASDLAKAKEELEQVKTTMLEKDKKLEAIEEDKRKAELEAYVLEKVNSLPFKALYLERLKGLASKEAVDAKVEELKSFASGVVTDAAAITSGKGKGEKVIEDGDLLKESTEAVREKMKAVAGIPNSKKE